MMIDPIPLNPEAASPSAPNDSGSVASAARKIGLKSVRAWVPAAKTTSSKDAERVRRHREKTELNGHKQISVTLPLDLHPLIKTLAARTKVGESVSSVLTELLPDMQSPISITNAAGPRPAPELRGKFPAWRRWLLRWLLPADYRTWLN